MKQEILAGSKIAIEELGRALTITAFQPIEKTIEYHKRTGLPGGPYFFRWALFPMACAAISMSRGYDVYAAAGIYGLAYIAEGGISYLRGEIFKSDP